MTSVPRIYNQNPKPINLNKNDAVSSRINNGTWILRYNHMRSVEGYNNGKKLLKCLSIKDWKCATEISSNNKATMYIENNYFYNSINRQKLYVNFGKLKYCDVLNEKINYFFLYQDNDNISIHKMLESLRREGYNLTSKYSSPDYPTSIIPEMSLQMVKDIYGDENNQVLNIVLMAKDYGLLPFVQHFQTMGIKFTLVVSPKQAVSNHYLNHMDYFVDAVDFMKYADCLGVG